MFFTMFTLRKNFRIVAHLAHSVCVPERWHSNLFWQSTEEAYRSSKVWGIFHDLKPLEALFESFIGLCRE